MVLETTTLPIELYPYQINPKLLGFFVCCMFVAEFAIFAEFNSVRVIFFVFVSLVVALFAIYTSQRNSIAITLACHVSHPSYLVNKTLTQSATIII